MKKFEDGTLYCFEGHLKTFPAKNDNKESPECPHIQASFDIGEDSLRRQPV